MPKDLVLLGKSLGKKPPWLITRPKQLKDALLQPDWLYHPVQLGLPANPQIFGRLLRTSGFQAVLYRSTKPNVKKCIAIFVENLDGTDSFVELVDPCPEETAHKRLDAQNWEQLSTKQTGQ